MIGAHNIETEEAGKEVHRVDRFVVHEDYLYVHFVNFKSGRGDFYADLHGYSSATHGTCVNRVTGRHMHIKWNLGIRDTQGTKNLS